MPMNNTRTVDCIVVEGTRYCEKLALSTSDIGIALLVIAVAMCWVSFWMWYGLFKSESMLVTLGGGFIFPMVVGGVILLLI